MIVIYKHIYVNGLFVHFTDIRYGLQLSVIVFLIIEAEFPTEDSRGWRSIMVSSRANDAADFRASYGGLFFIGIVLSIVFLLAAVLIIYYKQVSEGYEDVKRFEIMQKVGMTKPEIKRSIASQLLLVFMLPLAFAGMHLAFAFPMIRKMLRLSYDPQDAPAVRPYGHRPVHSNHADQLCRVRGVLLDRVSHNVRRVLPDHKRKRRFAGRLKSQGPRKRCFRGS